MPARRWTDGDAAVQSLAYPNADRPGACSPNCDGEDDGRLEAEVFIDHFCARGDIGDISIFEIVGDVWNVGVAQAVGNMGHGTVCDVASDGSRVFSRCGKGCCV